MNMWLADCIRWTGPYVDENSINGVRQTGYQTVRLCQNYCASLPTCVAIDFNYNDMSCWIHTNISNLDPRYRLVNVHQYRLNRECRSTTTSLSVVYIQIFRGVASQEFFFFGGGIKGEKYTYKQQFSGVRFSKNP